MVCPHCKVALDVVHCCPNCARCYPAEYGIVDFAEGAYYDRFDDATALTAEHLAGLELEVEGTRRRVLDFYLPKLPAGARVLDCGCGNGVSVDLLVERGFDAWGNDLSQLRKWQWRERVHQDRLVVASGLSLPFADGFFDVVISSGVIEHIGVDETSIPRYAVAPRADRDELRARFLRELLRVGRTIYIDCPNGAFPIDFWHGDAPGSARFHSPREGFLPAFREIAALVPGARVEALSPYKRLQFRQAARHWYGRAFGGVGELYFRWMPRAIAKSALNPFLIVRIERQAATSFR